MSTHTLSCVVFFVSVILVFALYVLMISVSKRRLYKHFIIEKEKAAIVGEIAKISNEVQDNLHSLEGYPNFRYYVLQAGNILKYRGFSIDGIEVSTLADLPENAIKGFDKKAFFDELLDLSQNNSSLYQLAERTSNMFGRIFRLRHPVRFAMVEIKKKLYTQILRFLVNRAKKRVTKEMKAVEAKAESKKLSYDFVTDPLGCSAA